MRMMKIRKGIDEIIRIVEILLNYYKERTNTIFFFELS